MSEPGLLIRLTRDVRDHVRRSIEKRDQIQRSIVPGEKTENARKEHDIAFLDQEIREAEYLLPFLREHAFDHLCEVQEDVERSARLGLTDILRRDRERIAKVHAVCVGGANIPANERPWAVDGAKDKALDEAYAAQGETVLRVYDEALTAIAQKWTRQNDAEKPT